MNNIDNILEKYFEGISSAEDEKTLKNYFRSDAVLPRHEAHKPLFAAFEKERQMAAPAFEIPKENKNRKLSRKLWIAAAGAAAAILLAAILFPFNNKPKIQSGNYLVYINGKEVTNPQKAQQYAAKMFGQADEIIRASYEPFVEANAIQKEMNADKIFENAYQKINYIESIHQ
ncbi:MAG: hypothetical protein Q4G48_05050 [Bacteroidia bacterium]|nr:hypothetical protein [Bacteroidia bacterium]